MEISFDNVSFRYNSKTGDNKQIFENLNIKFQVGKINAVIGNNGSGKSTLMEMLDFLNLPDRGTINIDDFTISSESNIKNVNDLKFKVGLVFQEPEKLFFHSTVFDELAFYMKLFNYKKNKLSEHVKNALIMVGLDESYLDKDPISLSIGEKRLVAIASSLIFNPKVLVMDSPTIGLDAFYRNKIIKIIKMLKRRYNKTIIILGNDVDIIHKFADYIYILDGGMIVLEGTKYDVFSKQKELKKYGVTVPKIIAFENMVYQKKGIRLGYRDDINDLLKDIYRNI